MMADLKTFVKNIVEEVLKNKYPYVLRPSTAVGRVVATASVKEGYIYTVCILDPDGEEDPEYPEIPNVWSNVKYEVGNNIAVAFLDKRKKLYIMGSVVI